MVPGELTVLVEEIASQHDHVDIVSLGQDHDLFKGLPAVILSDGVSLLVADMIVRRHENANCIVPCADHVSGLTRVLLILSLTRKLHDDR